MSKSGYILQTIAVRLSTNANSAVAPVSSYGQITTTTSYSHDLRPKKGPLKVVFDPYLLYDTDYKILKIIYNYGDNNKVDVIEGMYTSTSSSNYPRNISASHIYFPSPNDYTTTYNPTVSVIRADLRTLVFDIKLQVGQPSITEYVDAFHILNTRTFNTRESGDTFLVIETENPDNVTYAVISPTSALA